MRNVCVALVQWTVTSGLRCCLMTLDNVVISGLCFVEIQKKGQLQSVNSCRSETDKMLSFIALT